MQPSRGRGFGDSRPGVPTPVRRRRGARRAAQPEAGARLSVRNVVHRGEGHDGLAQPHLITQQRAFLTEKKSRPELLVSAQNKSQARRVEGMSLNTGGHLACQAEGNRRAYEREKVIRSGQWKKVGINCFVEEEEEPWVAFHPYREEEARKQLERLGRIRRERDEAKVREALERVREDAAAGRNVMLPVIDAVERYATVGEVCGVFYDCSLWEGAGDVLMLSRSRSTGGAGRSRRRGLEPSGRIRVLRELRVVGFQARATMRRTSMPCLDFLNLIKENPWCFFRV